jgi:hypothetical protein
MEPVSRFLALRRGRVLDDVDNGQGAPSHAYSLVANIHFPHLLLWVDLIGYADLHEASSRTLGPKVVGVDGRPERHLTGRAI